MEVFGRRVAVVGSRAFQNYPQIDSILKNFMHYDDLIISGGAIGVDSMAQRWAKANGFPILIVYPNWKQDGSGAGFARNKKIVDLADVILAFYAKGSYQQGGTSNTVEWAKKLGVHYYEFEENDV